jgi:hypothetical protein
MQVVALLLGQLAERGSSAHEIMSVTGHRSLSEESVGEKTEAGIRSDSKAQMKNIRCPTGKRPGTIGDRLEIDILRTRLWLK